MHRSQIYLEESMFKQLMIESKLHNLSISEIIRQSISNNFKKNTDVLLKRMEKVAGIWSNKNIDTNKYIRTLRKDRKI